MSETPETTPTVVVAFDRHELIPAVVQDATTAQVLMLGYMNREAYEKTLADGEVWFWSRSRGRLWRKGESSGNVLKLRALRVDCDGDTILVLADPAGPTCHTNAVSCFFTSVQESDGPPPSPEQAAELFATIRQRLLERVKVVVATPVGGLDRGAAVHRGFLSKNGGQKKPPDLPAVWWKSESTLEVRLVFSSASGA